MLEFLRTSCTPAKLVHMRTEEFTHLAQTWINKHIPDTLPQARTNAIRLLTSNINTYATDGEITNDTRQRLAHAAATIRPNNFTALLLSPTEPRAQVVQALKNMQDHIDELL